MPKKTPTTSGRAGSRDDVQGTTSTSQEVVDRIESIGGWRGERLARIRALILKAEPRMVEEIKWRKPSNPAGVPVWSSNGIVCTGEALKDKVKLTFMHGAALDDPSGVFNAGFGGNTRRAIDLSEGDTLDERAFKALIKAGVAHNAAKAAAKKGAK